MTSPLVYIMFKLGMENKQYGISFEDLDYKKDVNLDDHVKAF